MYITVENVELNANHLLPVLIATLVQTIAVSDRINPKNQDPDFCSLPHMLNDLAEVI